MFPGKPRSRWEEIRKYVAQKKRGGGEDLGSDGCGGLTGRWFT